MLTIAIATLFASPSVASLWMTPIPLTGLCRGADVILVAVPGETTLLEWDEEEMLMAQVDLEPMEVIAGERADSYRVEFEANLICPAPPSFMAGVRTLVFLRAGKDDGYSVDAYSYGTMILSAEAEVSYLTAIRELLPIQRKHGDRWRAAPEYVEWVVRCAEDPQLVKVASDDMEDPETWTIKKDKLTRDANGDLLKPLTERFSKAQLLRISRAIQTDPRIDKHELWVIVNLQDSLDFPTDDVLFESLTDDHAEKASVTGSLLHLLAKRWKDPVLIDLSRAYRDAPESAPDSRASIVERLQTYLLLRGK